MTPDAANGLREPWLHDPRCREAHGPERTSVPCEWHARPGERQLDEEPETLFVRDGSGRVVRTIEVPLGSYARSIETGHLGHHDTVHAVLATPQVRSVCVGCRNPRCPDHWRAPWDWPRLFHPLARRWLPRRAFTGWCLWRYGRLVNDVQRNEVSRGTCH